MPAHAWLRVAVAGVPVAPGEPAAPAWFGESERARWPRLGSAARAPFVAGRALLRELLRSSSGLAFDAWHVSAEAGVAPRASATPYPVDAVHVSLSHRLGWVAAACGHSWVGVDVEVDRPPRSDADERAALMLAPGELVEWRELPEVARAPALLARWTAKEAWFKACLPPSAPWDFRRVHARACAPADANVRTWRAAPVHVAVCCGDARALAAAQCDGLPGAADEAFWRVAAVHEELT